MSSASSREMPWHAATVSATAESQSLRLRSPRWGTGLRYGASDSMRMRSKGTEAMTSGALRAFL